MPVVDAQGDELEVPYSVPTHLETQESIGPVPHRVTNTVRDTAGTVHERVFSDFQFADKLDPKLFGRP